MWLYYFFLIEHANKETREKIEDELTFAPLDWRDPVTGLPQGFTHDEEDEWDSWESAARS